MTFPSHVPLVVATRNAHVERIHWGSVAVVDTTGALLAHAGDPHAWVFSRSTLKPFQALPFVRDGGPEHFGFTDAELTEIDRYVRRNTINRFGPVREVAHGRDAGLVFEVAFEGLQQSTRHKSGIAMRFPRINRIRTDKPAAEADTIDNLLRLVASSTHG